MVAAPALAAPRPVFCVIDHAYRDTAVAEAVCAGRFTHAGTELDLGLPPDWVGAALPADEEWRIEWTKFYFGLDLAHAYGETGELRFLRAWEQLALSFADAVPVGLDAPDVAARRVQNWIYAWRRFASAPWPATPSEAVATHLLDRIREETAYIRGNLTKGAWRNHRTLELYALMVAALAFPDEIDPDGALLSLAVAELHASLVEGTRRDGVHRESSTHYHLLVLRSFLGARENARCFGVDLPAGYDERLARACDFAMHCHRPDGRASALSDADSEGYGELLDLAATLLGRQDLRWVGTGGKSGRPPSQRGASFPEAGYFTQRSGWGEDGAFDRERYLIFDCGPIGDGGHGHYDLLSVEVAGGDGPLLVDPGRFTYSEEAPNMRRWFKGTAAHNTVCVDGLDQTPYRRGRPRGAVAEGRLIERLSAPGLDLIRGQARSPRYEVVHTRAVAFVAGEYWLIEDDLRAERAHRYDLRFHLSGAAQGRTAIDSTVVRAPGLALVLDPALDVALEPGWVSERYGSKHEAPVVSAVARDAVNARFLTLVAPLGAGRRAPGVRVRRSGAVTAVEVRGVGPDASETDIVEWRDRGHATWTRRGAGGEQVGGGVCRPVDVWAGVAP
jgi:hypothetical protein